MEIGSIIPYTGNTVPDGFLVCDGSAISRSDYSSLFDVIGTTYGVGDGFTTFNLPNLSGKVAVGASQSYSLGSTGGESSHILLEAETPAHTHTVAAHTHESTIAAKTPTLSHTVGQPATTYTGTWGVVQGTTGSNYAGWTGSSSVAMSRTKNLAIADHAAAACTMSGGVTDCPAFDTETTGLGTGHDNMMPYLSLTYLIYAPETVYPPGMVYFNGCMVAGPSGCYFTGKW